MALRLQTTLTAKDDGFKAAVAGAAQQMQVAAEKGREAGVASDALIASVRQVAEALTGQGQAAAAAATDTAHLIEQANGLAVGLGQLGNEAAGVAAGLGAAAESGRRTATAATEAAKAVSIQAEAHRAAAAEANAHAVAAGNAATDLARRMDEQARAATQAGEAQRRLNDILGVRPPANDAAERAADYAEWGRRIDAVRARYVPLEQQLIEHRRALEEIAEAERLGMLTSQEATAARTRATAALRQAEAAHHQQAEAANGGARSTKLAAHEMTNLSYQIQDVFVQLASGQNPFLILAQQGPQATAAVGGLGRLLSLIPPQLLLVAGVTAGLAVVLGSAYAAWSSYRESVLAVDRANRMAPVSIGLTRAALEQQARAAADLADISVKAAREQQAAYIATGKIGGDIMSGLIGISRDFAVATGQEMSEATAQLAQAFADPAKGAEDLTRSMGLLDDASLVNVRSLAAMGRGGEAQAIILEALEKRVRGSAEELTLLGRAVSAVGSAFSNAWDWIGRKVGNLFTEDTQGEASALEERVAEIRAGIEGQRRELERLASFGMTADNSRRAAALTAARAANEAELRQHQERLTQIERDAEAERQAERAKQIGITTGAMARQLDEYYARQEDLTNKQKALQKGLEEGSGFADRGQVEQQLDRVRGALGSLMTEQAKATKLAQAEAAAVAMTGVARDQYLAKVRAEVETSGQLLTAKERQTRVDQAVAAVTNQHSAALADLTRQQRLAIEAQQRLADAAGKGEAATRAANDANEIAAAMARSAAEGALAVEAAKRREAAWIKQASNESIGALTLQREANDRMATAVMQGTEAVRAAQRAEYEMALTRKYGAGALAEIARELKAYDDALRSGDHLDWAKATAQQAVELQEVNGLLGVERANLTASNRQRRAAIAHQEALNELARIGVNWTEAEREAWLRNADAIAAARGEAEALSDLRNTIDDVASDAADAVYEGMTGRGDSILSWFKALWKRIAVEALKQQIILPIVTQVVGGMPGLFGAGGTGGGLSQAGGFTAGAGGTGGLSFGGLNLGLSQAMQDEIWAFAFNDLGLSSATSDLIAGGLGSAGWGTIGVMGANLLGLGKGKYSKWGGLAGSVGGAIGGQALGTILGMAGGPIGAILGGFAGTALASLLGPKPSDKEGNAVLDLAAGRYTVGGFTGRKYSQENRDAAAGFADQALNIQKLLEQTFGAKLNGTIAVGAGNRDGIFSTYLNSTERVRFESTEEGAEQLISFVTQQFVDGIREQLAPEISEALGRVDFTDLEKAAGDMDFIVQFRDSLKALRGDFGLTDAVTAQASAEVKAQMDALTAFRDNAARLFPDALGETDLAIRQYVDGLIGVREAVAPTEIESALSALEARWQAYIPLMEQVGYTTAEAQAVMAAGLAQAKEAVKADWVGQMDREFNDLIGNGFINQLRDLMTGRDGQYANADALGVDRGIVDRNVSAALGGIVTSDLRPDQLQEIIRLFGADFPEAAAAAQTALDSLTGAVAGTGNAAAQAEQALRTGQAMDGLADRMARATGAADTLEGQLAIFDRAAEQERAATQARVDAGEIGAEILAETESTLTAERLAIIRRFGQQAEDIEKQRLERLAAVNQSISDRLFAATNDNSTLAGALAEFDRQANKDRAEAAQTAGADLTALEQAIAAERLAIIRQFGQQAAEITRSIEDREFARSVAGRADADILLLERRQNAEFAAAAAAGYTIEQLERLRIVLAGEMTDAVNQFNEAARQAAQSANASFSDRLFAATTDSSTLEGALATFDRQAGKDRLEAAKVAGADMAALERALGAERAAIIKRFTDEAARVEQERLDRLAALNKGWADRLFAATNDNTSLAGALAAFDRQAADERIEAAQAGGADMLALETTLAAERAKIIKNFSDQAIAAEKQRQEALTQAGGQLRDWIDSVRAGNGTSEQNLATVRSQFQQQLTLAQGGNVDAVQGLREYAQRLIEAETNRTASGEDRRAMVNAILAQVEALPAVKSWDQQILEELQGLRDGVVVEVSLDVIRTITEQLNLLPAGERDQLVQAQTIIREIEEKLGRSLTPAELDALIEGEDVVRTVQQWLGRDLTSAERAAVLTAANVERRVEQVLGRQLTAAEAATLIQAGGVPRTVTQTVQAATGATLVLPEAVTRTINQVLTIQGQVLTSQGLSQQIAIELGNVQFQSQALANRYLAAIAANTGVLPGAAGGGLWITDDPNVAGDQAIREQRAAALSVSVSGGNTDNAGIIAAMDRVNTRLSDLHSWQASVWAVESQLLDKTKYNTAETAKKLGGGYAYEDGTDFHPGGWATVGEEGPERVYLPRGAQVFTRDQTLELSRQPRLVAVGVGGGGGNAAELRALAEAMDRQARATERQNALLEKIAAAAANGADAAAETAAVLNKSARVKVGTVGKLRRAP